MKIDANKERLSCIDPKPTNINFLLHLDAFPTTTEPMQKSVISQLASEKFEKSGTVYWPREPKLEGVVLLAEERY